jgi:hypothetical protein
MLANALANLARPEIRETEFDASLSPRERAGVRGKAISDELRLPISSQGAHAVRVAARRGL